METVEETKKPLEGILVVAIEQALAAPLCTNRLAEMGARVIKVERAEGDFARGYDSAANGESSYFVWTNRGKESIVIDFKQPDDAALLHRIIGAADIFIQNLAPGALKRAGFSSASLRERNPRLITCDISGYGDVAEVSHLKAYDMLVQCESGLAAISGAPEAYGRIGVSICDIGAGMNATIGVLSALAQRERTGQGLGIEVSLFDGAADWMTIPYLHETVGAGAPTRQGLRHPSIAPYGAFATADGGEIVISIQNEREWTAFCRVFLRQPELASRAEFSSNNARVRNRDALESRIGQVFGALSTEQALQRLAEAQTAFGQVRSVAEFGAHPALRTWPMPVNGRMLEMIAPAVRTPWDEGFFRGAPALGSDTARIAAEFAAATEETA